MQLRLKKGSDRRFRDGHPWVFSNEITVHHGQEVAPKTKPKPGLSATLCSPGGDVLAQGYYNPHSLIAFRITARGPEAKFDLRTSLQNAWNRRLALGYRPDQAFRWVYGEADDLPGLVVDHYGTFDVVQSHTAGVDVWIEELGEVEFQKLLTSISGASAVQLHQDLTHRKHEGLEMRAARWLGKAPSHPGHAILENGLKMEFDATQPQKTGLFLDQVFNQNLLIQFLARDPSPARRVLDLFSYVGQWSCAMAHALSSLRKDCAWVLSDSSDPALALARKNLTNAGVAGAAIQTVARDLLRDPLTDLGAFDVVIADPPALIAARSSIPQGTHAYLQVFEKALRAVRPGGWIVASSCSSLLEPEALRTTLSKAERRAGVRVQWVAQGGLPPDHPRLMNFPEGSYLKAWIGRAY